jgi:hypothetical protein
LGANILGREQPQLEEFVAGIDARALRLHAGSFMSISASVLVLRDAPPSSGVRCDPACY